MNELETTIREQQKRLKRYDNIDGTGEMFFGAMLLGFLLSTLLAPLLPPHSFWTRFPGMLLAMLGPVYAVLGLAGWGVKTIKRRITYRRTGYVLPRRDKKAVALALVYAFVLSAVAAAGLALLLKFGMRHNAVSVPRLLMLSVGVATYVFVTRVTTPEQQCKMWFAALMALVAVAASFSGWTMEIFNPATMAALGVIWIASGLFTLRFFIRHTQPMAEDDE
jgi:MFS family permease